MAGTLKDHLAEALIGLLVVVLAAGFVVYAWGRTGAGEGRDGMVVSAHFPNIGGVTLGTDVKLAGVKIGRVVGLRLDPVSYQAVLDLSLDHTLKLPVDSSAAVTAEGLLGGNYVAITPGAEPQMLKNGDEIIDTSGAPDLMSIIGSVVNRTGGDAPPAQNAGNASPK